MEAAPIIQNFSKGAQYCLIGYNEDVNVEIHHAAFNGDTMAMYIALEKPGYQNWINSPVGVLMVVPLHLAVKGQNLDCIIMLLKAGAEIDRVDRKGQTPLFVATSEMNLEAMQLLLQSGANCEGSSQNSGRPLINAVRDKFHEGVKLLLQYGADTEPYVNAVLTCAPGWPLYTSVVNGDFQTFLLLLKAGANPNFVEPAQNNAVVKSIPHAILKYVPDRPKFVELYYESGGNLAQRNEHQKSVADLEYPVSASYEALMERIGMPPKLQFLCCIKLRRHLKRGLLQEETLKNEITLPAKECILFEKYDNYA